MTHKEPTMQRRDFSFQLMALSAGLAMAQGAVAQPQAQVQVPLGMTEGKDFIKLATPVPVTLPAGKKIEVMEFFSYGCPHCAAFEPVLEAWVKQLPADVSFRAVPYAFFGAPSQQKMFYALEELGQREALHRKLFDAIHVQKKSLNTDEEITAFLVTLGVDGAKYQEAAKGFGVNNKMQRGKQIATANKIDGVPTLAIHGRFYTSPGMAKSPERALLVTNNLIQQVRQGG
jgi:protein dithiol oxidoreductase (disulfide-forming)